MEKQIDTAQAELRETFRGGKTRNPKWRKSQLKALLKFIKDDEEEICQVLHQDLGKPSAECFRDEIGVLMKSINYTLENLDSWMAPKSAPVPLMALPTSAQLVPGPLGLVLIFSSWNFPFCLALDPLVGAIAAGNTAVIKPSEHAPSTSAFLAKKIPMYLDSSAVRVFEGGPDMGELLMSKKWDHVFFTGGQNAGKCIMSAAAKNLTPVTLELGGKCPAILDALSSEREFNIAIRRITNAKWGLCCGQICIGVDYLLIEEKHVQSAIELLKKKIKSYYGNDPQKIGSMSRIVNKHHFTRLRGMLEEPGVASTVVHGGFMDESNLYIEPTILLNPPLESGLMTEEIFGPLLPIITVNKIEDSIDFVNSRPKPLALYAYTNNKDFKKRILAETSSGSLTFNDSIVQFIVDTLPFGGVGQSGFGRYHGKFSFDTFSHEKAVLTRNLLLEFSFGVPPWNKQKVNILRSAYKYDYFNLILKLLGLK
ncbi:aldehyde dehydrogenase family 3 member F1-like [Wolffia australiana]